MHFHRQFAVYAADALHALKMNLNPGGAQPSMQDQWFLWDGDKVIHPMNFPPNHLELPSQPKGMKIILIEHGLWCTKLLMKCKGRCKEDTADCCAL